MASDFSRTLALLRKEKKISQRTAAGDLAVSQALLSHYENGLREPGLSFVVRAADYYGVSCDYLLGRSMARDGSAVPSERLEPQQTAHPVSDHTVLHAAELLFTLAEQMQSQQLSSELEDYFSLFVYRAYRYLYMADPACVDAVFRTRPEHFDFLCDARQKQHELRLHAAARGAGGFGLYPENIHAIPISPNELTARYPALSTALLTILQQVSDSINALSSCSDLQKN